MAKATERVRTSEDGATSIDSAGALGDVAWWQPQPLPAYHGSSGISPYLAAQGSTFPLTPFKSLTNA